MDKKTSITGYKTILSPTEIIWNDYIIHLERVKDSDLIYIKKKGIEENSRVLDLGLLTSNENKDYPKEE